MVAVSALLVASIALAALDPTAAQVETRGGLGTSLASNCAFSVGEYAYDLCPLLRTKREWKISVEEDTPPTMTSIEYRMALGGPLRRDGTLPKHEQCEDGTWVCMTGAVGGDHSEYEYMPAPYDVCGYQWTAMTHERRRTSRSVTNRRPDHPSEPPRITYLIPVVAASRSSSSLASSDQADGKADPFGFYAFHADAGLRLVIWGGEYATRAQRALLRFTCVPDAPGNNPPTYAYTFNGTHAFDWATPHACATASKTPPKGDGEGQHEHQHEHDPPEEGDLLPPVSPRTSRYKMATIFLGTVAALCVVVYAAMHPPEAVKRKVAPYARRVGRVARRLRKWRGRPGEVKLVRWAEEDLPTFGLDDDEADFPDAEEGRMVNARSDPADDGFEERIPLKPSPKLGYGSVSIPRR